MGLTRALGKNVHGRNKVQPYDLFVFAAECRAAAALGANIPHFATTAKAEISPARIRHRSMRTIGLIATNTDKSI
jgi:hypothetical protein